MRDSGLDEAIRAAGGVGPADEGIDPEPLAEVLDALFSHDRLRSPGVELFRSDRPAGPVGAPAVVEHYHAADHGLTGLTVTGPVAS